MQEFVGETPEGTEQPVSVQVVDGGLAHGELAEFLDALLARRSRVVEPPGREGVDARQVGQNMGRIGDLVAV